MLFRSFEDFGSYVKFSTFDIINGVSTEPQFYQVEHEPLKPCPHCGGNAEVQGNPVYSSLGARVRCKKCGCNSAPCIEGTPLFFGDKNPKMSTIVDAIHKTVSKWNARTPIKQ